MYAENLTDLEEGEKNEVVKNNDKHKTKSEYLVVGLDSQPEDVQFWRIVIPNILEIEKKIWKEYHAVPYNATQGVSQL